MDRVLDTARTGPLYLRMPELARMVVEAIFFRDGELKHYELHAYVVMPNHVHLLITPFVPVSKIMHSLKKVTAREGNRILGFTGPFWQDESYDRLVRNGTEFDRIAYYIVNNPVKAGLVTAPEEFLWSGSGPILAIGPQILATCPTAEFVAAPENLGNTKILLREETEPG